MEETIQTKVCIGCKIEKSISEFHKLSKSDDGFDIYCKECKKEFNKKLKEKYRENNKKSINNIKFKICSGCGIEKDISKFDKNQSSKDGYSSYCKQCKKEKYSRPNEYIKVESKICNKCGIEKNVSEFSNDITKKDSLDSYCKDCKSKIQAEYYYNNIEKESEYSHKKYLKHSEQMKRKTKEYYKNNKNKVIETNRIWKENNKEKVKEIHNGWKSRDLLRYTLTNCLSRARKNNIPFDSKEDLYDHLKSIYDKMICECCGCQLESGIGKGIKHASDNSPSLDRIIPELGYIVGNVAILCFRCNEIKHDATIQELKNVIKYMEQKLNKQENLNPQ